MRTERVRKEMEETDFIRILNTWFVDASLVEDMPFQFKAHTRHLYCPFFILLSQNDKIDEENTNKVLEALRGNAGGTEETQYPLVIITPINYTYQIGIFAYWEYNRCHLNVKRNMRYICPETLTWIETQIQARRMHINSLPEDYIGVIKTISLNTKDFVDAEIIYWRKLTDIYKMTPAQPKDDKDHFNRLLNGTPENEFPCDVLDTTILQQAQSVYPEAKVRSKLLLFDNDLLNIRQFKDKLSYKPTLNLYLYNDINFQPLQLVSLIVECYYYPNFFNKSHMKSLGSYYTALKQDFDDLRQLYNMTYKPLSFFNL